MTDTTLPPATNAGLDPSDPPRMPFWHMTNSDEGRSMIVQQLLDGFAQRSVSGESAAIWMREFSGTVSAVWFNILPLGWIGDWHPSPSLQWVVPVSGRWFIETQDGKRVEMGPGDIHWGADIENDREPSKVGHRSGQLGDVPCIQLMVQFAEIADDGVTLQGR